MTDNSVMNQGRLTQSMTIDPPGTRTVWADRVGGWLVILARYPGGNGLGWHAHEHASFHLTLAGSSDERYWRVTRGKLAGTAQYYGHGIEHTTTFGPSGALVLHAVPPEELSANPLVEPDPTPLLRVLREIGRGDEAGLLSAEAWCEEMADSVRQAKRARPEASWPDWLTRVRSRLFDDPAEAITVRGLAEGEGLDASHLARTFRERLGLSVGAFQRRRRLQVAADALCRTRRPVASIALDAGFCDQSHFGRAFKQQYGATPAAFREDLGRFRRLTHSPR